MVRVQYLLMKKDVIIVKDLVKRYKKAEVNAVDGVSFSVGRGEFFSLLGPNGAGKTTTISILTTTLGKTSGTVKVAGFDIDKKSSDIRNKVGIIFQNPSLDLNLSAEENVRFHAILYGMYPYRPSFRSMPDDYKNRVKELSEVVGISDSLFSPVKSFSGGMKRKLEIVRSLMHEPEILFLDEPTSGLDPLARKNLWEYLKLVRDKHGTTVFLTTHYLDESEGADRVCVINHGKVQFLGSPTSLKKKLGGTKLILDSKDRSVLEKELKGKKIDFEGEGPFKVPADQSSMQTLISSIDTKLSLIDIENPTLEEAYIALVGERRENNHA